MTDSHPPIDAALRVPTPVAFDRNPAALYLAALPSESARRVMSRHLRTIAALLIGVDPRDARTVDIFQLNWAALREHHTRAIRARLVEEYSASSVNRMLNALRGILQVARYLDAMSEADYARAAGFTNVEGEA